MYFYWIYFLTKRGIYRCDKTCEIEHVNPWLSQVSVQVTVSSLAITFMYCGRFYYFGEKHNFVSFPCEGHETFVGAIVDKKHTLFWLFIHQ